jgi:hypothetical protein
MGGDANNSRKANAQKPALNTNCGEIINHCSLVIKNGPVLAGPNN